jgi:hypothetical protein
LKILITEVTGFQKEVNQLLTEFGFSNEEINEKLSLDSFFLKEEISKEEAINIIDKLKSNFEYKLLEDDEFSEESTREGTKDIESVQDVNGKRVLKCNHCYTEVPYGAKVCTGCQAEVHYGTNKMSLLMIIFICLIMGFLVRIISESSEAVALAIIIVFMLLTIYNKNKEQKDIIDFRRIYKT